MSDADTLDSVSDRGAITDKAIEIGDGLTIRSGANVAVIDIDPSTGRLRFVVNGKKQVTL